MKKVTFETKAWANEYTKVSPESFDEKRADGLIYGSHDMSSHGYSVVGNATITVELLDQEEITEGKIAALREAISKTRADAAAKVTRLEGEIQKLLCIENAISAPVATEDDCPF